MIRQSQTLTVNSCKAGLRSTAALIATTLLLSASPSGALASHSSMVRVDFGCGVRILKAGVFERLAAMNFALLGDCEQVKSQNSIGSNLIFNIDNDHQKAHVFVFCLRPFNIEWSHTYHGPARFSWRFSLASAVIGVCQELARRKMYHHFSISDPRKVEGHLIALSKFLQFCALIFYSVL